MSMFGYAPPQGSYGQYSYAMSAPRTGGPDEGALDKLKAFMDKETAGVKNKYLVAGAAALGLGYYGYTKGWF